MRSTTGERGNGLDVQAMVVLGPDLLDLLVGLHDGRGSEQSGVVADRGGLFLARPTPAITRAAIGTRKARYGKGVMLRTSRIRCLDRFGAGSEIAAPTAEVSTAASEIATAAAEVAAAAGVPKIASSTATPAAVVEITAAARVMRSSLGAVVTGSRPSVPPANRPSRRRSRRGRRSCTSTCRPPPRTCRRAAS